MRKRFWRKQWVVVCGIVLTAAVVLGSTLAMGRAAVVSGVTPQEEETVCLPAIMYHGLLKDSQYQGQYVISPNELEQDLVYLQKHGYTPVHMEEVFGWQDGENELPEKPILLTFDDGYYNNYLYAYPLAQKYNMKLIIAPIGNCTDKFTGADDDHANYSHITWPQIQEMMDSGLVEFQNHTYDLHASKGGRLGTQKLWGESMEEYRTLLQEDIGGLQERFQEETGYTPTVFVFPFGAISDGEMEIIWEMGFRGTFTCAGRMNQISKTDEHLILGRYLRPHGVSSESYFAEILS